jgi:hypothetical protein
VDEATWQTSTKLFELLALLGDGLSDRKRRLFAVACCRRFAHLLADPRSRTALDMAERFAEGHAGEQERLLAEGEAFEAHFQMRESRLDACAPVVWSRQAELLTHATALTLVLGRYYAEDAADYSRWSLAASSKGWLAEQDEELLQCRLLRDIAGPAFRPVRVDYTWRAYNDGAAYRLARWIHEQRDFASLPILGDALEEAGCADEAILAHCRKGWGLEEQARQPIEHVCGCWVVDLVLGLE